MQAGRPSWIAAAALCLPAISIAQQIAIGEYAVPTADSDPERIATGSDGALWFAEYNSDKIGRATTAGAITDYAVPTAKSGPSGIAAGPDGALWFTEINGNKIGRTTTAGAVTEYAVPTADSG